ncbi:MAG: hypothetical protein JKZ03_00905, partial [Flavobacteriaceae bacterium]|nr:hypothetical protein [Flavobacteriaceae bacterium]
YKKGKPEILITENSAVPGMLLPVINQEGYYRLDLGLLGNIKTTDVFQANYYHEGQNLQHKVEIKQKPSGGIDRLDISLLEKNDLPIPKHIKILKKDKTITLTWEVQTPVHIYRRSYPDSKYYRVATSISGNSWTDVNTDVNYGYILTGTHPDGSPGMHSKEYTTIPTSSFLNADKTSILAKENVKVLAFETDFTLAPGASKTLRILRQVQAEKDSASNLKEIANLLLKENIEPYRNENKAWVKQLNLNQFKDKETQLLYLSAANMMKQQFYPPEGKSSHNYYVFSREPTWGWGHGGQVFHESLTMLAYAQIDPLMAMDSQRVYEERQYPNGYINYRTGSYLDEIINYKDTLTSSAPWYAWQNYEVYKITKDKDFLEKMYHSSVKFYNFFVSNRDYDQDGLAEWGGHAVLESVRDAAVAVWDEVAWPSNFDGVDVNSMLVMEAKALEQMARELGLDKEAEKWKADHMQRAHLINQYMWDEETGFYYNIDRRDNDFSYNKANDLKRMEIIGFLPLWAGICSDAQAAKLVAHLTDTSKFWRSYGVPSLSADDPFYNDKGYWNGPVWVEWNYLIFHGLKHYGYHKEADELTKRNAKALVEQLKINHNLWEFYSPDAPWAGYHKTYIWAGIINRMIKDSNLLKP